MVPELQETFSRASDYHKTIQEVKEFAQEYNVVETKNIVYLIIMGMHWKASTRNEKLTNEDAEIFLNLEEGVLTGIDQLVKTPGMEFLPLNSFLDYYYQAFFKDEE